MIRKTDFCLLFKWWSEPTPLFVYYSNAGPNYWPFSYCKAFKHSNIWLVCDSGHGHDCLCWINKTMTWKPDTNSPVSGILASRIWISTVHVLSVCWLRSFLCLYSNLPNFRLIRISNGKMFAKCSDFEWHLKSKCSVPDWSAWLCD